MSKNAVIKYSFGNSSFVWRNKFSLLQKKSFECSNWVESWYIISCPITGCCSKQTIHHAKLTHRHVVIRHVDTANWSVTSMSQCLCFFCRFFLSVYLFLFFALQWSSVSTSGWQRWLRSTVTLTSWFRCVSRQTTRAACSTTWPSLQIRYTKIQRFLSCSARVSLHVIYLFYFFI